MRRKDIDAGDLTVKPYKLFSDSWLLLSVGDFSTGDFNMMTIGWGGLGVMWDRPAAFIEVRPSRHTYSFIERYDNFTLCAFPHYHTDQLLKLGTTSGKEGNKIEQTKLTPDKAYCISSPVYKEASLVIECRKLAVHKLDHEGFKEKELSHHYPDGDFHYQIIGQILHTEVEESSHGF